MWAPRASKNLPSVLDKKDYSVSCSSPMVCGMTLTHFYASFTDPRLLSQGCLTGTIVPTSQRKTPSPPSPHPHLPGGRASSQDLEPWCFPHHTMAVCKGLRATLVTCCSWQPRVRAWKHPPDLTLSRTDSRSLANCV